MSGRSRFEYLVQVLGVVSGALGLARIGDRLPPVKVAPRGCVVVAIPAHNEAVHIETLLASIARQRCEHLCVRVIVVDDASDDDTAERAYRAGAQVIRAAASAVGVNPKSAALAQVNIEGADWVVFIDADVELVASDVLERLVALVEANGGGLVSIQPRARLDHWWAPVTAWLWLVPLVASGAFWPGAHHRSRVAFGPVLAMRAATYRRVGGHAAIVREAVDDVALARSVRHLGEGVSVWTGGEAIAMDPYSGLGDVVVGLRKNLAIGATATGALPALGAASWVITTLAAFARMVRGDWKAAPLALGGFGVAAAGARRLRLAPWRQTWLVAAGLGLFVVTTSLSVVDTLRGQTWWHGRRLRLR